MCLYFILGVLTLFLWKLNHRQTLKLKFLISLYWMPKTFKDKLKWNFNYHVKHKIVNPVLMNSVFFNFSDLTLLIIVLCLTTITWPVLLPTLSRAFSASIRGHQNKLFKIYQLVYLVNVCYFMTYTFTFIQHNKSIDIGWRDKCRFWVVSNNLEQKCSRLKIDLLYG